MSFTPDDAPPERRYHLTAPNDQPDPWQGLGPCICCDKSCYVSTFSPNVHTDHYKSMVYLNACLGLTFRPYKWREGDIRILTS